MPDDIIDDADTRLFGTTDPGYIAGLSNHFRYKTIDFNFELNGLFDRAMMDPTYMAFGVSADGIAQYGYNGLRVLTTRWTPDNPSTTQPSSFLGGRDTDTAIGFMRKHGLSVFKTYHWDIHCLHPFCTKRYFQAYASILI